MIAQTVNAVVEAIKTLNTDLNLGIRHIDEHAGAFIWEEFTQRSYNNPAVFVSNLGFRELKEREDQKVYDIDELWVARFGIAVITQHSTNYELRNRQGRLLCEYLARYLKKNNFGLLEVSEAYDIKVDPRFMAVVNDDGQALWIIDWYHQLPLQPEGFAPLDDFEGVDIDHANPEEPAQILAETTVNYDP